jgi:hypothetical protein
MNTKDPLDCLAGLLAVLFVGGILAFLIIYYSKQNQSEQISMQRAQTLLSLQKAFSADSSALAAATGCQSAPPSTTFCLRDKVIIIDRNGVRGIPDHITVDIASDGTVESVWREIPGEKPPRVSALSLLLPEETLASTPNEAGTVILVDWYRQLSNTYVLKGAPEDDRPALANGYLVSFAYL